MLHIRAVVAASKNHCIGVDNDLPWHIPQDLKHFKKLTSGKPVIMGRKTFESIVARLGKPLPNRLNIVLSRGDYAYAHDDVVCAGDIETAIEIAKKHANEISVNDIIIGGGAQIYKMAMPFITAIDITRVEKDVQGDAFLPPDFTEGFKLVNEENFEAGDTHPPFSFLTYQRI